MPDDTDAERKIVRGKGNILMSYVVNFVYSMKETFHIVNLQNENLGLKFLPISDKFLTPIFDIS